MATNNAGCHSIDSFISNFKGGTRTNRFRIIGGIGRSGSTSSPMSAFHIRTASMPEAVLGKIPINYRGRTVNYPGDRVYLPWQITVLDESGNNNNLYKAFHTWHNAINNHTTNISASTNPKTHFATDWSVEQYDTNGSGIIKKFLLKNCWPIGVGQIPLSMNEDNQLAAFSVTMLFTHYTTTIN